MAPTFVTLASSQPITRYNEHMGSGRIVFRRLLNFGDFRASVDFVDYTIIPPGSTIGRHEHVGNEEIYFIASGTPVVRINGEEARLEKGSVAVVRSGEWHELVNDTDEEVEILVVQVRW
jgi:mannose-6-phosphate isomerase-like protein (cupin superfamily)